MKNFSLKDLELLKAGQLLLLEQDHDCIDVEAVKEMISNLDINLERKKFEIEDNN